MKRTPKPFSVEIKKSRLQAERIQLPPKRLFGGHQADISKIFAKDVSQAAAEPSAPSRRILPSIIEPFSSGSEPVETVRQKRSNAAIPQAQIDFDWPVTISATEEDGYTQASVKVEAASEVTAAAAIEEDVVPVRDVQSAERDSAPTTSQKARKKAYRLAESTVSFSSLSQPERPPTEEVAPWVSTERPFRTSNHRQIDRQAAAAQLPRQERWKRRLPTAAW